MQTKEPATCMLLRSYKEENLLLTKLISSWFTRENHILLSYVASLLKKKRKRKEKSTDPGNSSLLPASWTNPHGHLSLQQGDN